MSILVALHHRTTYRYDRLVSLGPQTIRLRPAPHCRTRILSYALTVSPTPHFTNWQQDPQSNHLARIVFPEKTNLFSFDVDLVAEMTALNPFDFFLEPSAEHWPWAYEPALRDELAPYLAVTERGPKLDALVASLEAASTKKRPTMDFLVDANQRLARDIRYVVRLEPGLQSPEETLTLASGSCRDSAWLLVQALRRIGLAARFASGYLIQLTADVKSLDGPNGPEADFTDLHAWCEVYLPGAGWIGLDPTSGLLAGEGHIPLACAADPRSAAPVTGLVDRCETAFEHAMKVTRIHETPRVTKPTTEGAWRAIDALGEAVDKALAEGDVRLTMGGEPTFVSADHLDDAEWNTAALGPNKKPLAAKLFEVLREKVAPLGLVHAGQGKWYPGEPLPRWALSLFFRHDGEPLFEAPELLSRGLAPKERDVRPNAELLPRAKAFARAIAEHLGADPEDAFPAYEDAAHYLLRERRLPVNVDVRDPKLTDPLERERLVRLFTDGLGTEVGWVLPIGKREPHARWASSPWRFRGGHCFLVPGDSPLGLRLPLDSQPWAPAEARDTVVERDPSAPAPKLPPKAATKAKRATATGASSSKAGAKTKAKAPVEKTKPALRDIVRTALAVEPREGVLHVFLPPVESLDDWVELVGAVEAAAVALDAPIRIEGYRPPRDARLGELSVTPDPGVIEVNVQPVASWRALVDQTTHLYEAARGVRLAAEKFMIDGKHTGTGGGNHVVLGGATTADSPFLRRPDLLQSLLAYFHQHPSLSYLFSGQFIGPTSQAPRVDEARNDALYELEIAFKEIARHTSPKGEPPAPWIVDRVLRDLLVDVTGNTHRAEFCIDKLYSPDSASGRLGLVELRGFEMPPHAEMSLLQALLLRALVAKFWSAPFAPERLTRWGTELHDRFMLPFFVWQDFEDVLADLRAAGFAFDAAWFAPHFEFRFPVIGDFAARGVVVELRSALEPWHVLGEDAAAGGTARYVDSSLERLQVKASGLTDRFTIACNRVALPLRSVGRPGEAVAGVRYRAWQPPRCLHPLIPVDTPLTIDLVDTTNGRSVCGATYHVAHPGGRAHDTRPINALEAEGRRDARFFRNRHSGGKLALRPAPTNVEHPLTLDMRTVRR